MMSIWHTDALCDPLAIDGVTRAVWTLASGQAADGHDVTIWCRSTCSRDAVRAAKERGITIRRFDRSCRGGNELMAAVKSIPPDVVHIHSSWVWSHALLAARLRRRGVPYVVTPHGSHTRAVMSRRPIARRIYRRLVEEPLMGRAHAVVYCHEAEAAEGAAILGLGANVRTAWMGPQIDEFPPQWDPTDPHEGVAYLGRFEVFQKGLDLWAELAAASPTISYHLHGLAPRGGCARKAYERMCAAAPPNLHFEPAVFAADKSALLERCALYLQYSRYEGFPLAVAEALAHGTPVALRGSLGCARVLSEAGACFSLDDDARIAARQIEAIVADPDRCAAVGARGRSWFLDTMRPTVWPKEHVEIYAEVLAGRTDRTP